MDNLSDEEFAALDLERLNAAADAWYALQEQAESDVPMLTATQSSVA